MKLLLTIAAGVVGRVFVITYSDMRVGLVYTYITSGRNLEAQE